MRIGWVRVTETVSKVGKWWRPLLLDGKKTSNPLNSMIRCSILSFRCYFDGYSNCSCTTSTMSWWGFYWYLESHTHKKHANYFSECHFLTCICTEPRIRPFCISRYQTNKLFAEWKTFKTSKPIAIWLQRKRYDTNFVLSIDCAHFSSSHSECIPSTYIFLVKNESGCFLRDSEFIDFQLAYWERTFFPDSPRQYDSSLSIVVNVMHSIWNGFIYRHPLNHLQMWAKTNWNYIISWTNSFQSIHRRLLFA